MVSPTRLIGKFAVCAMKTTSRVGKSGTAGRLGVKLEMGLAGEHNALNATAAAALAYGNGIPKAAIQSALASFKIREAPP